MVSFAAVHFSFFRHIKTPHLSDRILSDKWGVVQFRTHSRLERAGIVISEENKKSEPFSYREKFGFCCCGAPPGTRTLGPLIKRNQRATIVNFQNYADSLFLSFYRKFAFCICCILCTCYFFLHPLSSRSGVQKVCKNVQSQNQPLKTGIGFLCKAGKPVRFEPKTAAEILPV